MKKLCVSLLALLWALLPACSAPAPQPSAPETEPQRQHRVEQAGGTVPHRNAGVFQYKTVGDLELTFYLKQPAVRVYDKAPLVVNFVGPGWTHMPVTSPILYLATESSAISQDGIAQMTVTYRGTDHGGSMEECLADLMDAFSYLSLYNDIFGLDMSRIALVGQSAGGHVALMLLLAPPTLWEQACQYPAFEHRFCGAVAINPATEWYHNGKDYSPINYVRADMGPVLLGIGTEDTVLSPDQSRRFYQKAQQLGAADVTKVELQNAGHGLEAVGGTVTPDVGTFYRHAYARIRQWMGL